MKQPTLCPVCNQPSQYDFSSRDLMFGHYKRYDYHRCTNCHFIFQHPLPTAVQISSFYPNEYEIYEEQSRLKKVSGLRKSILKKYYGYSHLSTSAFNDFICFIPKLFYKNYEVQFNSNGSLLDVRSGNGRSLDGMKKLGWQTKCVEFNESATRVCKLPGLNVHHGIYSQQTLIMTASMSSMLVMLLSAFRIQKNFFAELSRILKKEGMLIIKIPNSNALGRASFSFNWFANEVPRHIYLFYEKNIKVLASTCKLKVQQLITRTSPKIILNSLDYVMTNSKVPSKRIKWKRLIARTYVLFAQYKKQGDELFVVFTKH